MSCLGPCHCHICLHLHDRIGCEWSIRERNAEDCRASSTRVWRCSWCKRRRPGLLWATEQAFLYSPPRLPFSLPHLLPAHAPPRSYARRQIADDYAGKRPLVVGTLKGAVVFMADLVRAMEPTPQGLQLEFVRASSYGSGTVSSGKVALSGTLAAADVEGRHVLLVRATARAHCLPPAGCTLQACPPTPCTGNTCL